MREYEVGIQLSRGDIFYKIIFKVKEVNPKREGKKLLVLDIDYTLFDHRQTLFNRFSCDLK